MLLAVPFTTVGNPKRQSCHHGRASPRHGVNDGNTKRPALRFLSFVEDARMRGPVQKPFMLAVTKALRSLVAFRVELLNANAIFIAHARISFPSHNGRSGAHRKGSHH